MKINENQSPTESSRKEQAEPKKIVKVAFTVEGQTYELDVEFPERYLEYNIYTDVPISKRATIFQNCVDNYIKMKKLHQEAEELLFEHKERLSKSSSPKERILLQNLKTQYCRSFMRMIMCTTKMAEITLANIKTASEKLDYQKNLKQA